MTSLTNSRTQFGTVAPVLRYGAIAAFVAFLSWSSRGVFVDDAYIYARYIRNALSGDGLVFNRAEHINALTSPVYCYLVLGLAKLLHANVILAERTLFVVFLFAACVLAEYLVPFAGVLMGASQYFYTLIGMETPVFLCLIIATVILYQKELLGWLPLAYVLLALTRFDGVLLAVVLFLFQAHSKKFSRWYTWLPVAGAILIYLWLNVHWYGQIFPGSVGAKFGQGRSGYWGRWPTAFFRVGVIVSHFVAYKATIVLVPVLAAAAIFGWRKAQRASLRWVAPMVTFLAVFLLFCTVFNIPNYHWYYAPFVFFAIVFAAFGIPSTSRSSWITLAAACCLCAINAYVLKGLGPNRDYQAADAWLLQHTTAKVRVASEETGLIGWQLKDAYIIDTIGLTTPRNASYVEHRQPGLWLAEDSPDYIFVHDPAWTFEKVVLADPGYAPVPETFGHIRLYKRRRVAPSDSPQKGAPNISILRCGFARCQSYPTDL